MDSGGDAKKVKTCVSNLTVNALKYTPRGSVTVTAPIFYEPDGFRAEGRSAIECVGCVNPPEKPETISRDFEQVGSSTQHRPGTRLGLGV